jgi:hypothetical protein
MYKKFLFNPLKNKNLPQMIKSEHDNIPQNYADRSINIYCTIY